LPAVTGISGTYYHAQLFFCWDGHSEFFFSGLAWPAVTIHQISVSCITWYDRHTTPCLAIGWDEVLLRFFS
jgi:hypothetical protein